MKLDNALALLFSGCLLELLYILLMGLVPLPEMHLTLSPLASAWSWTLVPSHILLPKAWIGGDVQDWHYQFLLGSVLILLAVVYAFAVGQALHLRWHGTEVRARLGFAPGKTNGNGYHYISDRWLLLLLLGAAVFGITLLFQPALFSHDVFNYIFSGRLLTIYHADPITTAPWQFAHDPYFPEVSQPSSPSMYGPLQLTIASLLVRAGNGPISTFLLFKGLGLLSHLLNCFLTWSILTRVAPARRFPGTLLYAWNPLALIELAGNGHAEGVFLTLLLLATWLYVSGKGRGREMAVLALFGLAIAANLVALLVAPLYIWFSGRAEQNIGHAVWGLCWRLVLVLAIPVMIFWPFWHGATTFLALTSAIDLQHFMHSPLSVLASPLRAFFGLIAQWAHFPPDLMQPTPSADVTLRASGLFLFALIYFALLGKVRRAPTTVSGVRYSPVDDAEMKHPGFDVLLTSWSIAILGFIVCVSGSFWPEYLLWVLWAATLRRLDVLTTSIFLLSCTALLAYPLSLSAINQVPNFTSSSLAEYQPLLIFGIPLVYWILRKTWHGRSRAGQVLRENNNI